jgi:hypothetical protein
VPSSRRAEMGPSWPHPVLRIIYVPTLTRPSGTLSHPMGEGWGEGAGVLYPAVSSVGNGTNEPVELPLARRWELDSVPAV